MGNESSLLKTKTERQESLQTKYNFICNCQPCAENWPPLTTDWKVTFLYLLIYSYGV